MISAWVTPCPQVNTTHAWPSSCPAPMLLHRPCEELAASQHTQHSRRTTPLGTTQCSTLYSSTASNMCSI